MVYVLHLREAGNNFMSATLNYNPGTGRVPVPSEGAEITCPSICAEGITSIPDLVSEGN